MEWWVCKGAASISSLTIDLTYANSIIAVMLEYSGGNGLSNSVFQAVLTNQNTITSQYILETVATTASPAALMIGLFSALGDSFNASPPSPSSSLQTVRSTNSLSIPPALSYQVVEQGNTATVGNFTEDGENLVLAVSALNITAESATQLATSMNVAASTIQCLYIVISGGLILNTQPGWNDQPDSALVAGNYALGLQVAKISGNAALGMCRMEVFQGTFTHGQNASGPYVSTVDGYVYQANELTYIWGIYSSANPSTGWISTSGGSVALWYCNWNVDQETGDVTCEEWYNSNSANSRSNDGTLQVFIVAQRQQTTLTAAATPSWTQKNPSLFVQDLPYAQDMLQDLNNDAKFSVIGQECLILGAHKNGDTISLAELISPADDYEYAYSEVKFVFSWMFTTETDAGQQSVTQPPIGPYWNLASLYASINASNGLVTCEVGMGGRSGESYGNLNTYGMIAVFALCQRARTGTPAEIGNKFAEIPNSLFYPGNVLPAGLGAQLCRNINEAACTPEFFGPTLYALGATIPTPVSTIDGYVYQRSELTYLWEWGWMATENEFPASSDHLRTALFAAQIDQDTGVITNTTTTVGPVTKYTSVVWRCAPGVSYIPYTTFGLISVIVVAARSAQQTEVSGTAVTPPTDAGSSVGDQNSPGAITVNGV
jgi:hypothetical protein